MLGTSARGASWKRSWRVCIPEAIGIRVSGRPPLLVYRLSCDRSHSIRISTFRKSFLATCCVESSAQSRRRLLTDHRPLIFKHQRFCRRMVNLPIRSYYPFPVSTTWRSACRSRALAEGLQYGLRTPGARVYSTAPINQRSRTEAERYVHARGVSRLDVGVGRLLPSGPLKLMERCLVLGREVIGVSCLIVR